MNLFFCGGIAKSGTTLLQKILNLHNDISCEFEDDLNFLLKEFLKIHILYNTKIKQIGDRIGLKEVKPVSSKVYDNALFKIINDIAEERKLDKKFVGISDNNFFIENFDILRDNFKNSKSIMIFRNPVDRAISLWNHNHRLYKKENNYGHIKVLEIDGKLDLNRFVIHKSNLWNSQVKKIFEKIKKNDKNLLLITYELLCTKKSDVVKKIFNFIGCEYDDTTINDILENTSLENFRAKSSYPEFYDKGSLNFGEGFLNSETIKKSIVLSRESLDLLNIKIPDKYI
tara:strand:+ start:315 stop:1169 length:855 start_codon:yes stop_codon:yes gene_type:complete